MLQFWEISNVYTIEKIALWFLKYFFLSSKTQSLAWFQRLTINNLIVKNIPDKYLPIIFLIYKNSKHCIRKVLKYLKHSIKNMKVMFIHVFYIHLLYI